MHTLYCKGWQGPATRESGRRKPLDEAAHEQGTEVRSDQPPMNRA